MSKYMRNDEISIKSTRVLIAAIVLVAIIGTNGCASPGTRSADAVDVPRMSGAELNSRLGQPDLILVDVRAKADWEKSGSIIAGAHREDPSDPMKWMRKYSMDKTLVFYCA